MKSRGESKMKDNSIQEVSEWLEEEIRSLKSEIDTRHETANSLQKLVTELKEYEKYAEYKNKYDDVAELYKREQERLIKLHNHYRKIEEDCENLRATVKVWEDWFYSNKETFGIFDRLFSAAPPMGVTETVEKKPPTLPPTSPKTKKKKR